MRDTHCPERSNGAPARGVTDAAGAPRPPRCAWTRTLKAHAWRTASTTAALARPSFMIHPGLDSEHLDGAKTMPAAHGRVQIVLADRPHRRDQSADEHWRPIHAIDTRHWAGTIVRGPRSAHRRYR